MRSTAPVLFVLILFTYLNASAQQQIWGDPHVAERFATEAGKDPGYKKFKAELETLLKDAKGSNTNAAAVKALFARNTAMLNGLYRESNIEAPVQTAMSKVVRPYRTMHIASVLDKMKIAGASLVQQKTPPYLVTWLWANGGYPDTYPDSSLSQFAVGKTAMVYQNNPTSIVRRLGRYYQGPFQSFKVPSNPEILAAEIRFEYSFLYTAWDTYGGITGVELLVRGGQNFVSADLKNLSAADGSDWNHQPYYVGNPTDYSIYNYAEGDSFKVAKVLYPRDTVSTNIQEFHAQDDNGTFVMRGYVIPGSTLMFNFGPGFMLNTRRGLNGNHHYLEFRLKKITVTYLKSAN